MEKANFGFVGLGVMGSMLALNMERHGYRVAGYDLDAEKVKAFGTGHLSQRSDRLCTRGRLFGSAGTSAPHHDDGPRRETGR